MENTKYINGKKVNKKSKGTKKTLKEKLIEHNQIINNLSVVPADRNPKTPTNWYVHQDLYALEFNKRLDNLNKLNLNKAQLKVKLIEVEMEIAFVHHLMVNMLLPTHFEGRKAINKSIEHISQSETSRKDGVNKRYQKGKDLAKEIISEITKSERPIHQNDFDIFRIKSKFAPSTARKYWQDLTGFKSTKKFTQLKS